MNLVDPVQVGELRSYHQLRSNDRFNSHLEVSGQIGQGELFAGTQEQPSQEFGLALRAIDRHDRWRTSSHNPKYVWIIQMSWDVLISSGTQGRVWLLDSDREMIVLWTPSSLLARRRYGRKRASVPDREAGLRVHQDPLPRDREEPQPPPHAVRLGELLMGHVPSPSPGGGVAAARPSQLLTAPTAVSRRSHREWHVDQCMSRRPREGDRTSSPRHLTRELCPIRDPA